MVTILLISLLIAVAAIALAAVRLVQARKALGTQAATLAAVQAARQLDLFRVARRDTLTQLANRQTFTKTLAGRFARNPSLALLLIDLDGFDRINANLGHAIADELLQAVAARIQAQAEPEHAARIDGDTFALLLTSPADLENLAAATARIAASLAAPYQAAGQLIDAGASIGVAHAPAHGPDPETLVRAAQAALVQAKQGGGNRVHICGHDQADDVQSRQRTRRVFQRAIEAGEIVPYYQPIIHLPTGQIAKFEVLARWNHPQHGLLAAEQFIPAADEMGLSGQISMSLLRQVAADTEAWPKWCRYAINVSPGQVRELIGLLNTQPGAWQRRMDLSRLDVEISEAALTRDPALARELIDVLHEHNAQAVLDNFGSESNFFHLRDMPFDTIKISKTFVQTLAEDPRAEVCVLSMLSLGLGLGIEIVADGVETTEVAGRLAALGCTFAQGFLYARPGPANAAASLLGIARALEAA